MKKLLLCLLALVALGAAPSAFAQQVNCATCPGPLVCASIVCTPCGSPTCLTATCQPVPGKYYCEAASGDCQGNFCAYTQRCKLTGGCNAPVYVGCPGMLCTGQDVEEERDPDDFSHPSLFPKGPQKSYSDPNDWSWPDVKKHPEALNCPFKKRPKEASLLLPFPSLSLERWVGWWVSGNPLPKLLP